jgi:orotate phosphoribosyltransferase
MIKKKKIKISDIELEANELGYKLSLEPKFKYAWIYGVPRGGVPAAFALSANMNHYGCRRRQRKKKIKFGTFFLGKKCSVSLTVER